MYDADPSSVEDLPLPARVHEALGTPRSFLKLVDLYGNGPSCMDHSFASPTPFMLETGFVGALSSKTQLLRMGTQFVGGRCCVCI